MSTGAAFRRECVKLSPPNGKYLEVLLTFQNTGKQKADEAISVKEAGKLNISLTPSGGQTVSPIDFVGTGFSTSRLSQLEDLQKQGLTVVSQFTGSMSIYLDAGGKTWILLLFDVPKDSKSASLRIRDSDPVTMNF